MSRLILAGLATILAVMGPARAEAAALQVAPVLLDVPAPGATTTLTLRNEGARPLNAQIRIFRWVQEGGRERLEPATDVVASPPATSLAPRTDYTVRVVRIDRAPVTEEKAYRLVVDELPDADEVRNGTISVVLRHSVPVFFSPPAAETARVRWSARVSGRRLILTATNTGGRRLRLAALSVSNGKQTVQFGAGLVGYALAGRTMTWERPLPAGFSGSTVRVVAQSDLGAVDAQAPLAR